MTSRWCVACERVGNYEEVCNSCLDWGICQDCISQGHTLFSFWHPPCIQIPPRSETPDVDESDK